MRAAARERAPGIEWRIATAAALPFPDASFDGVVCTLAVHHFPDREAAFREVRRVLRGGPFVVFACDVERTRCFWLRAYFPKMFERMEAREPSEAEMRGALSAAGFREVEAEPWFVPDDLADHFLYCGKRRPELYFDAAVRAGISSFANLSDPEEVETGLARLRADLESGRFPEVAAAYPTPDGDYVFLRARG
jgi:SAM-dependent methyltransferase